MENKESSVLELLVRTSKVITSEIDLEKLVQRITDLGTELTGAAFGAFFYNVIGDAGEKYVLYTISGVPKEAFSKFPMPRNTAIFNPTFTGAGTVRYDDVTSQPHFGKSAPYFGMPKGHLPVRSYLATPVISSYDGEVFGGLFFGHPESGVFTAESEKLIEGIATQAAIAMANARLFEDKKQSEQKLLRQNAVFNTIANNTIHGLLMMDDRHHCTYMNPASEQMTGYLLQELQGKPLHYFIHQSYPDGRPFPMTESAIDRALPNRSQVKGEDIFTRKDGSFFPVAFTASPIIEDGVAKGTVIEVRNITDEKRSNESLKYKDALDKQELAQKVRERTIELEQINYELLQFTSVASHDLKEPIRKISIFSKMLADSLNGKLNEKEAVQLRNIIQTAGRMKQLIDDLLTFSRLSRDNTDFENTDINALLKLIASDLEIIINEHQAELNLQELPVIKGIPLQLGQVFQNLISNSLKFRHPDRRPVISVNSRQIEKYGRQYFQINYSDNGIGFDNVFSDKIFQIFQRLHSRDEYEGTGVGLAIVRKIVALHGGEIRATGKPGIGAEFEILFPIVT